MGTKTEDNRAKDYALSLFEFIVEMVEAVKKAHNDEDYKAQEQAEEIAIENAVRIEVRSGWCFWNGDPQMKPAEFKILLCGGGPSVQIVGDLDNEQPDEPVLQYQDWGTPWIDYPLNDEQKDILAEYCGLFCFEE